MLVATECQEYLGGVDCETVPARQTVRPRINRLSPTEKPAAGEEDRSGQWECLHRWLARSSRPRKVPVAEMIRAYEEATGTCICCD